MLEAGWLYWLLWLAFLLIANLTIMRMLTGVILNQTNEVNARYKDESKRVAMEEELVGVLSQLDEDHTGKVSRTEFRQIFQHPELLERLSKVGVDLQTFLEAMLESWPDTDVAISDIVEKAFAYRGSNPVTFRDLVESRRTQEKLLARQTGHIEGALLRAQAGAS
ncbi:unnamed protein product [Prorocentrum cordatum]|uniref:EF-hand domain-containing protein n=1 Tax=Prorocentrum cordatum TaxID=2364126 RepID=A0ABN9UPN1_9DINO|nr:unnamed protein product [Polarella glacialis]